MILLAHHVELQHYPVLAVFLGVGVGLGWRLTSFALQCLHSSAVSLTEEKSDLR